MESIGVRVTREEVERFLSVKTINGSGFGCGDGSGYGYGGADGISDDGEASQDKRDKSNG